MLKSCIIALLTMYAMESFVGDDSLKLTIKQGVLKGKKGKTDSGRTFFSFTGIPFAQSPVGKLRFKAPVPALPWKEVFDATGSHEVCPQINIYSKTYSLIGDEDCLFLNVYIPQWPDTENSLLPVLFYIYGGSFIMGGAKPEWLGPELLLDKDVILVTANYRLGSFGFLTTGDEAAPGNYALKDQNLALKWVKENIVKFGGDPNRITIFGNSAGAACAHFHMISPMSKDLISGAIIQSGSAVPHYAYSSKSKAVERTKKFASLFECPIDTSENVIECLRNVSVADLVMGEYHFKDWDNDTVLLFRPVIEDNWKDAFITEEPIKALQSGKAANIPIMIGIVENEAAFKGAVIAENQHKIDLFNKQFKEIVSNSFAITSNVEKGSQTLKKFYFGDEEVDSSMKNQLTDFYTDGWFLWGMDKSVTLHTKHYSSKIYKYLFSYRGSATYTSHFSSTGFNYGVCHTDELLHLFKLGLTFPNYKPSCTDSKMKELLTSLWTNFATFGNPTPGGDSVVPTKWDPVKSDEQEYYHIKNYNDTSMSSELFANRTKLWRSLL